MSEGLVIDLTEMMNVLNDMMNAANPQASQKSKSEWQEKYENSTTNPESDMINKYKKLYEASVKLENLKKQRADTVKYIDRYNEILESIDSKIDELNKLFSN